MQQDPGSFRDRSGYVFLNGDKVVRTIELCYKDDWEYIVKTNFLEEEVRKQYIIEFSEGQLVDGSWKSLNVKPVPFISYPYEWSFSQLKDAALLTLKLQLAALDKGLTLKDASAYNIQYIGPKPIFIDLLSFEILDEGKTWQAYRQFCSHFLAPLAIASKADIRLLQLSRQWIDGIPLDIAWKIIPWKYRFSPGMLMHIFLHAVMQNKYADPRSFKEKKDIKKMNKQKLVDIIVSLECAVNKCVLPKQKTEWADYYNDTNYSDEGTKLKLQIVEDVAKEHKGKLAIDLGANTGRFSRPLAPYFETVISADIDPVAVDVHYNFLKENGPDNILPLVLDLSSPSPSLGWANEERACFSDRCNADFLLSLALCHHLFFTVGAPFQQISSYFAKLLKKEGILICEFIPKEDSQVQRMLSSRDDIFEDYTKDLFDQAFKDAGFIETKVFELPGSMRTLHVFIKS
jgi:ribosomal protein L11 methylase PrmA